VYSTFYEFYITVLKMNILRRNMSRITYITYTRCVWQQLTVMDEKGNAGPLRCEGGHLKWQQHWLSVAAFEFQGREIKANSFVMSTVTQSQLFLAKACFVTVWAAAGVRNDGHVYCDFFTWHLPFVSTKIQSRWCWRRHDCRHKRLGVASEWLVTLIDHGTYGDSTRFM
jgi:hypothetical protein